MQSPTFVCMCVPNRWVMCHIGYSALAVFKCVCVGLQGANILPGFAHKACALFAGGTPICGITARKESTFCTGHPKQYILWVWYVLFLMFGMFQDVLRFFVLEIYSFLFYVVGPFENWSPGACQI